MWGCAERYSPDSMKRFLQKIFPEVYEYLRLRFGHPAVMNRLGRIVSAQCGDVCDSGPFKGMRIGNAVTGSHIPKLLGCYEAELHDVIESICSREYQCIIDVGCGEGYYAVGLAMKNPLSVVHAFDINSMAQIACADQAKANGVSDRVRVHGECNQQTLAKLIEQRTLVISDCEGYEEQLLDLATVPALAQCDILAELHELISPGVTAKITTRFRASHSIRLIDSVERDPVRYPALGGFSPRHQRLAINESRGGPMQWAWMTALHQ